MDRTALYRAVWRWHFYAGLIILPLLVWMAATGALYLYKPEIERAVYGRWTERQYTGDPLPLAEMTAAVGIQAGGQVVRIARPADNDASWQMTVRRPDGERRTVFVDPALGLVMGDIAEGGVMKQVRDLHSLIITGPIGNALVEIVAGWTIILCLTGFWLWWPRSGGKAIALRGSPKGRLFWRDLHASTGAIAGSVILFLAITGMPWSGIWGQQLQQRVSASGMGRPTAPGPAPWDHGEHGEHGKQGKQGPLPTAAKQSDLPWALQAAPPPHAHGSHAGNPDRIAEIAAARGIGPGWAMTMPSKPGAPWLVTDASPHTGDTRVLYIDGASGTILQDVGWADFGKGAQTIEWGIAVHQGEEYGEVNRLLMLSGCIAILLLAITAPILWWKRRFAPPPVSDSKRSLRGVTAIMLVCGALFPLTGATMVLALLADWIRGRMRPVR